MKDFDGLLHFTSFRISALKALYYKFNKAKIVEMYCEDCETTSQFICNRGDKLEECPGCEEEY